MSKYVGWILTKVHPSEWNSIAWNAIVEANKKNKPPLPEHELRNTFQSIINLEKSNTTDRWYKKDEKGLSTGLNEEVFQTKKDSIACPSLEKESPQGP